MITNSPESSTQTSDTVTDGSALKKRLLRGGGLVLLCRISGVGLAFVVGMILARNLTPIDFGLFLLTVSVIRCCAILARFGLDRALVRFLSANLALSNAGQVRHILTSTAHIACASISFASIACLTFMAFAANPMLNLPVSNAYVASALGVLVLIAVLQLVAEAFRGFHELGYASLFDAQNSGPFVSLLFLGMLVLFGRDGLSLQEALNLYMLAVALVVPVAVVLFRRRSSARLQAIEASKNPISSTVVLDDGDSFDDEKVFDFLPVVMSTQLLAFASAQADVWLAGAFASGESLALYGAAWRLMNLVVLPLNMLNLTVLSSIPELHAQGRKGQLQRILQTVAFVAALPAGAAMFVLLVAPKLVLGTIFGPFYADASTYLVILGVGQLIFTMTGSCSHLLVLTGHHHDVLRIRVAFALGFVVLGAIVTACFGLHGLAVAAAVNLAGSNVALWFVAYRQLGIQTHAWIDAQQIRTLTAQFLRLPRSAVVDTAKG